MDICIDFDGTCVAHEFPGIGKDIGAVPILKKLLKHGHRLILFTMRSDIKDVKSEDYNIHKKGGNYLTEAVDWFKKNGIELYGVNINPEQTGWTHSPKAYGQLYIDDASLGCPLKQDYKTSMNTNFDLGVHFDGRPYVDWEKVEKQLKEMGFFMSQKP